MKKIFLSFICSINLLVFAQAEVPQINKNSTNISPAEESTIEEKKETESLQDSTLKEKIIQKELKKPTTRSVEKSVTKKDMDQTLELKAKTFQSTKMSASTQTNQRTPTESQQKQMNELVKYYQVSAPKSFEYNYFNYISNNYNVEMIPYLEEARRLKPNNVDVSVQFAAFHFIKENKVELKKELEFLFKNEKIEKEVLIYAEDLLNSVEKNGNLITHGFDDTYSVLYLQMVKQIRTDVTLISLDFMQSEAFKTQLTKKQFSIPKGQTIDINYFENFCQLNKDKKLYISMTVPKAYLTKIQNNISIVGLCFIYQTKLEQVSDANVEFFNNSVQNKRVLKYETDKCKKLSSNYLPSLLSLRKYYLEQNNSKEVKEIDTYIEKISAQANLNINSFK